MGTLGSCRFFRATVVFAAQLACACGSAPPLVEAPPSLVVHNETPQAAVVVVSGCGQSDTPVEQHPISGRSTLRIPLARACYDFDVVAGTRTLGRQYGVNLRREMDWVIR